MADDTKKTAAKSGDNAETTLSKDSSLSINQATPATPESAATPSPAPATSPDMSVSKPVDAPTAPVAEPVAITPPSATETPAADAAKPVSPVVISSQEAEAADGLNSDKSTQPNATEELSEQVETLTGEIQALESKIERLSSPSSESSAPVADAPEAVAKPAEKPAEPTPSQPEMPKPVTPPPVEKAPEVAKAAPQPEVDKKAEPTDQSAVATFNDIFAKSDKVAKKEMPADAKAKTPPPVKEAETASGIGTFGEVLAVIGIITLAVALLGPFYRSLVSSSIFSLVDTIAWLAAPVALLISFVVLLFAKGKAGLKAAVFFLMLIAVFFYLAVKTTGSISVQLNSLFGVLFSAYK